MNKIIIIFLCLLPLTNFSNALAASHNATIEQCHKLKPMYGNSSYQWVLYPIMAGSSQRWCVTSFSVASKVNGSVGYDGGTAGSNSYAVMFSNPNASYAYDVYKTGFTTMEDAINYANKVIGLRYSGAKK